MSAMASPTTPQTIPVTATAFPAAPKALARRTPRVPRTIASTPSTTLT